MAKGNTNSKMGVILMGNGEIMRSMGVGSYILLMEVWSIVGSGETINIMDGEPYTALMGIVGKNMKESFRMVCGRAGADWNSKTGSFTRDSSGVIKFQGEGEKFRVMESRWREFGRLCIQIISNSPDYFLSIYNKGSVFIQNTFQNAEYCKYCANNSHLIHSFMISQDTDRVCNHDQAKEHD